MNAGGTDSTGRVFDSAHDLWREEIGDGDAVHSKKQDWYRKGVAYWEGIDATVDGMLGGYEHVSEADIRGSEAFLKLLLSERLGGQSPNLVALDCGSGIGRVSKNLLLKHCNEVDLVEPVSHFLEMARANLVPESGTGSDTHRAVNFYCVPLQEFTPEPGRYDVIWVQWCIGQLDDDDFISFFKRAKTGLKPHGFFILKENIARNGFVYDNDDRSITRSDSYFKELFHRCGLHIYKIKEQRGMPQELFLINMYALVADVPRNQKSRRRVPLNQPGIIK